MFQTMDVWIWFCGMGTNSEVKNCTGHVLCGADMDHVMAKPQLCYQESNYEDGPDCSDVNNEGGSSVIHGS